MNIKKLILVSSIVLQSYNALHSSNAVPMSPKYYNMANWNAAFLAYGGGTDPVVAASYVLSMQNQVGPSGASGVSSALRPQGTKVSDEADAVGIFVLINKTTRSFSSSFTATDVQNAIAIALGQMQNGSNGQQGSSNNGSGPAPQLSDTQTPGTALTANWAAAFTAFGGAQAVSAKTASSTMPSTITSTSAAYGDAQVIQQFLTTGVANATDLANLNAALTIALANNNQNQNKQLSDANSTNWIAAFAAFGGAQAVSAKTATASMLSNVPTNSAAYGDAQVIAQYLSSTGVANATDLANLQNALTAALPSAGSTATQTAASTLYANIQSAIATYNAAAATTNSGITPVKLTLATA